MRFLLYLCRWQLSSPILFACLIVMAGKIGTFWATIISNLIGGAIFFFVDRQIFKGGRWQ